MGPHALDRRITCSEPDCNETTIIRINPAKSTLPEIMPAGWVQVSAIGQRYRCPRCQRRRV